MAFYKLNEGAEDDVRRLYRYGIEQFGLSLADRYFDDLFDRFEQIANHPEMYPEVTEIRHGYRRSVFRAHSIYYRIHNEYIEIARVLGREDPRVLM